MRERRRLLERLQQCVLALLGHRVRHLDDEHAVIALERPVGSGLDDLLTDLLDQVLGARRPKPGEIGVRRWIQERPAARRLRVGRAEREELRRERTRSIALARPAGPAKR